MPYKPCTNPDCNCGCDCVECSVCKIDYDINECSPDFKGDLKTIDDIFDIYLYDVFNNVCVRCIQKKEVIFEYIHFYGEKYNCEYCNEYGISDLKVQCNDHDCNRWVVVHTKGKESQEFYFIGGCEQQECIDKQISVECLGDHGDCPTRYCWHKLKLLSAS